jgi:hypothetical protein
MDLDWRRVRTQPLTVICRPAGCINASRIEMLCVRMAQSSFSVIEYGGLQEDTLYDDKRCHLL